MYNSANKRLCILILVLVATALFGSQFDRAASELVRFSINPFVSADGIPEPPTRELHFEGFSRDYGYYIVQFSVPLDNSVRESVLDVAKGTPLGAASFGYVPDNCLIYRLSKESLNDVRAVPGVRWVGPLQPQFRISQILLDDKEPPDPNGRIKFFVNLFKGEDVDKLVDKLSGFKFMVIEKGSSTRHEFILFDIDPEIETEFAFAIAQFEGTEWVERRMPKYTNNDWSRWINQSYNTSGMGSVASGWYAQMSADATHVPVHYNGLYGDGEIVGSSDTGLDFNSVYFCDTSPSTPPEINFGTSTNWTSTVSDNGHRKVRAYSMHSGTDYRDRYSGHGSHTAGSIAGNNQSHNPPNTTFDAGDGMAPLARYVFSDLEGSTEDALNVPSVLSNTIFKFAYNHGARIHSNSWGSRYTYPTTHPYNSESQDVDDFIWDYKSFLIFFSAGNSNTWYGSYPPDRINGEGLGKNIVTVGAAESGSGWDNTTWTNPGSNDGNNPENNAEFSSHGPSSEGQMKPNLTACGGWYVFSADANDGGSLCHTGIEYMGGTSMSSPTTAGLAALIREYYSDGFYPSGSETGGDAFLPSAALVKATLEASCRNMTGSYTVDAVNNTGHQDVPSMGQGWGRVTLDDALYFDGDSRDLEVYDVSPGFSSTGEDHYVISAGPSTTESFKVVLSYSDYPSTPGAYSTVNDLNLEVVVNSNSYKGNVFASSGARSTTGGSYDDLNVDEVVWLNGSTVASQQVDVYVHCTSVPYGSQPYALVVVGDLSPNEPSLSYYDHTIDDATGDADGYAEKGESITMPIELENAAGAAIATSVTATVSESDAYISFTDNALSWPDISPGAVEESNINHCKFDVADDDATCGHVAEIVIDWSAGGGIYTGSDSFDVTLGCPAPVLEYSSHVIDDNIGGDNDGYPEPGESIVMPISLHHISGANAQDVTATISESDAFITVTDNSAMWPDIVISGTEQSLANHFGFNILPGCPEGRVVTFTIDWDCYCGSGSDNFDITIGGPAPELVYVLTAGIDDAAGDGDGYPEAGETIVMSIDLRNDGTENAAGVRGRISESDAYITISDNYATWPDIAIGNTRTSNANHFEFAIDPTTPCGRVVDFTLIDTCNTDRVDTNIISITMGSPAPDLSEGGFIIDDGAGGDGDGIPEAGETFWMILSLDNNIATNAHDVTGTISTGDAFVSIIDNAADWPDIAGLGSESTIAPHFTLEADPLTTYLHDASITLNWTAYCGSGIDNLILTIGDPSDTAPNTPGLDRPFPFERIGDGAASTEPDLSWFVPTDSDGDELHFETRFGTNETMAGATSINSVTNTTGFSPMPPVTEGIGSAAYAINSQGEGTLTNGTSYWWDARAFDGNIWGDYASNRSFTIDIGRTDADWFQTTDEQFETGVVTDLTVSSDRVISGEGVTIIFEDDFESYSDYDDFAAEWTTSGTYLSWQTTHYQSPTHAIRVNDSNTGLKSYFYHTFTPIENGFMEVWTMASNSSDEGEILRYYTDEGAVRKGQLYYRSGYVAYWDGVSRTNLMAIDVDTWHHFRIEFDCSDAQTYVIIDGGAPSGPYDFIDGACSDLDLLLSGTYGANAYTCDAYFDDYEVGQAGGSGEGTIVSDPIVFAWNSGFTAWDKVFWTQAAGDSVEIVCEWRNAGAWELYDSALANASATVGTLDIVGLADEDTIRLRGKLVTNDADLAELFDWSVSWASSMLGVEIYEGGPAGPRYSTTSWDIGQIDEGTVIVMNTGESAYIKNTGTVPIDILLKAATPVWALANSQGSDAVLLMGLFDLETIPPNPGDFNSPTDVLNTIYKLSGDSDPGTFASDASTGVDITVGSGRYLYLYFGAPTTNTIATQQIITVTVAAISSM